MNELCFTFFSGKSQFQPPSSNCWMGSQSIAFLTLRSFAKPSLIRVRIMLPVKHGSSHRFPWTSSLLGHAKELDSSWCRSRCLSYYYLILTSTGTASSAKSINGQTAEVHLGR